MTDADPNALERCLETVVERLDESLPDPADIEKGVVLPILQSLGWDVFNPKAVKSRIPVSGVNFDLGLCGGDVRPQLLLKIHCSRFDPGVVPGLLSRARRAGVSLVVLTNGPAWCLFVAEADADSAVPVFELSLSKADTAESAATLCRYLERCSHHPVFATKRSLHLARSVEELFPTRPDLRTHHVRLPSGWFLNTNTNTAKKEQEARAAAAVAGLEFGTDVIVDFRSP